MNTVLKQPTIASVQNKSSTVHRSNLSTSSSQKFVKFKSGDTENAGRRSFLPPRPIGKATAKAAPTSVLMESNSIANAANKRNNNQRRHTFCIRDEELLKILSATPDEPLYINDNVNDQQRVHTDTDRSFGIVGTHKAINHLLQYDDEAKATSPIVNRVAVDDNENLSPSDKCVLTNNEGWCSPCYILLKLLKLLAPLDRLISQYRDRVCCLSRSIHLFANGFVNVFDTVHSRNVASVRFDCVCRVFLCDNLLLKFSVSVYLHTVYYTTTYESCNWDYEYAELVCISTAKFCVKFSFLFVYYNFVPIMCVYVVSLSLSLCRSPFPSIVSIFISIQV